MRRFNVHYARRGATLIEVLVVVVIMSILSLTALPAFSMMREATQSAAVRELRRLLEYARAHASSSGSATGVIVDMANDTVRLQMIENGSLEQVPDGAGSALGVVNIKALYDGADVVMISGGVSAAAGESLWFSFDGTPHVRTSTGTAIRRLDEPVEYGFADGSTVRVHPVGGMIE